MSQQINQAYTRAYNNKTYRAVSAALIGNKHSESEEIDLMNLLIDASFERCGDPFYTGRETKLMAALTPDERAAAETHLDNFGKRQPPPKLNGTSAAFEEFQAAKAAGTLPRALDMQKTAQGYRIGYYTLKGFDTQYMFTYSAGVLAWLLQCERKGRVCEPTKSECHLRTLPAPRLYLEALKQER